MVPVIAVLRNLLESCKSGTASAIETGLSQLCLLINVRRAVIYIGGKDGLCHLIHQSLPISPDFVWTFPKKLPPKLMSSWQNDISEQKPIHVSGAEFLVPVGPKLAGSAADHTEQFTFFPMILGGGFIGVVGYEVSAKRLLGDETLIGLLRELTGFLETIFAVENSENKVLDTAHQPAAALVGQTDQENALNALTASAEAAHMRLTNAIHALPHVMVIFDAQDRLVAVNAAYHRAFPNLAEYAVVGVKLADLLRVGLEKGAFLGDPTEAEKEAWLHDRLCDYHKPHSEDEVQLPDGRWMHRVNTRTTDGGIIAMAFDITAKRNQIAALDSANSNLTRVLADQDLVEQRLRGIIDGAAVGTWEFDVVSDRIRVGGRWGEIIGLETHKVSIAGMADFIAMLHPEDQSKILHADDFNRTPNNQIVSTEFRMRHVDGHWVWILSRCRVSERAADGTPLRISGVHLDISEQKQLQNDVFASRAFLLDVMNASSSAIVVLDGAHRISYVNQEAERILGLICKIEPGQAFNISALKLEKVDGGALPENESPFHLALRATLPLRDIQVAFLQPDGGRGILSFNAAFLDRGDQQFGVVSFSDITESLTATQKLQEALVRAEEMSRAKSTFLANMSHEIRTPLNGVLGMAEVLADIVAEPLQRQMVDTIRKSGETLLTVLNGILDMSKIEAGKMALESVPFVPLDLIRQAEAIYAIAAEERGVEFEVLATAGCDKPRLGDAHRLMQVLNNLLNNAFKFTETGRVTLKFSCRIGKPVQIEVSDTGIGMDSSQVSRVFDSFEQADGSMTRRFGGTGLGLSIVRQLVTLMGGTIAAESALGAGSVFRILLPLAEAEDAPSAQIKAKESNLRDDALAGVRILCADDNATNRLVLSEMLAKTGALVTQVENGRMAVDTWLAASGRDEPFSLLLLDITMPVLDGMSALAEIRAHEAEHDMASVAAVAVTAHAMPSQVADYLIGGFDTHLPKPFRRLDLLHTLNSLLRR